MGVQQPEAAQAVPSPAMNVWEEYGAGVAYDDGGYASPAVEQESDLPLNFEGKLGEGTG